MHQARTWHSNGIVAFDQYFDAALHGLNALAQDGLVRLSDERIEVTELGRFFLRNIAMCFDAYLAAAGQEKPRYSRTI